MVEHSMDVLLKSAHAASVGNRRCLKSYQSLSSSPHVYTKYCCSKANTRNKQCTFTCPTTVTVNPPSSKCTSEPCQFPHFSLNAPCAGGAAQPRWHHEQSDASEGVHAATSHAAVSSFTRTTRERDPSRRPGGGRTGSERHQRHRSVFFPFLP